MQSITRDGLYSSQMVNTLATEDAFSKSPLFCDLLLCQIKTATS